MENTKIVENQISLWEEKIQELTEQGAGEQEIRNYSDHVNRLKKGFECFGTMREASVRSAELNRKADTTGKTFGYYRNYRGFWVVLQVNL